MLANYFTKDILKDKINILFYFYCNRIGKATLKVNSDYDHVSRSIDIQII